MCADRMRSIIIAIIIGLSMGMLGSENIKYAFIMQLIVIVALLVDGFLGFCPIRSFTKLAFPKCNDR